VAPTITRSRVSQTVTRGADGELHGGGYGHRAAELPVAEERSEYRRGHCGELHHAGDDDGRQWSELCCGGEHTAGTVTSAAAGLTVMQHRWRGDHPRSRGQTVTAGQTASFTVVATGYPPLSYQWRKSGVNIAGATAARYTRPRNDLGQRSDFRCGGEPTPRGQ